MSSEREEGARKAMRADFISEVLSFDEETGIAEIRMKPDPRRYEIIEQDGEQLYLDKYLRTAFSLETMLDAFEPGLPSYAMSSSIRSTAEYAKERLQALQHEIGGGDYVPPKEKAVAHYALAPEKEQKELGFLSLDICGATALRKLGGNGFDKAYRLFLRELGTVVGQFNGAILRTTGDGFIAYIYHPSYVNLCDAIIDLGLSLIYILHKSINPLLADASLPTFDIRVGADYGRAIVSRLTIPTTGYESVDISSDALNRSVKIQESSSRNEYRIGRELYELIHVQWLERAEPVDFDGAAVGIEGYKVYRVE